MTVIKNKVICNFIFCMSVVITISLFYLLCTFLLQDAIVTITFLDVYLIKFSSINVIYFTLAYLIVSFIIALILLRRK